MVESIKNHDYQILNQSLENIPSSKIITPQELKKEISICKSAIGKLHTDAKNSTTQIETHEFSIIEMKKSSIPEDREIKKLESEYEKLSEDIRESKTSLIKEKSSLMELKKNELKSKESEIKDSYKNKLGKYQGRITEHKQTIRENKLRINDLSTSDFIVLGETVKNILSFIKSKWHATEINIKESEVNDLVSRISEIRGSINMVLIDKDHALYEISHRIEQLSSPSEKQRVAMLSKPERLKIKTQEQKIVQMQSDSSKLSDQLKEMKNNKLKNEAPIKEAQNKITEAQNAIAEIEIQIQEYEDKLKQLENKLEGFDFVEVVTPREHISDLTKEMNILEKKLQDSSNNSSKLEDLRKQKKDTLNDVDNGKITPKFSSEKVSDINTQIKKLEKSILKDQEIQNIKLEINNYKEIINQYEEADSPKLSNTPISQVEEKVDNFESQVLTLKNLVKLKNDTLSDLDNKIITRRESAEILRGVGVQIRDLETKLSKDQNIDKIHSQINKELGIKDSTETENVENDSILKDLNKLKNETLSDLHDRKITRSESAAKIQVINAQIREREGILLKGSERGNSYRAPESKNTQVEKTDIEDLEPPLDLDEEPITEEFFEIEDPDPILTEKQMTQTTAEDVNETAKDIFVKNEVKEKLIEEKSLDLQAQSIKNQVDIKPEKSLSKQEQLLEKFNTVYDASQKQSWAISSAYSNTNTTEAFQDQILALDDSNFLPENVKNIPLLSLIEDLGSQMDPENKELLNKILSEFPKDLKIYAEYKDLPPAFKLLVDRQAALRYLSNYTETQFAYNNPISEALTDQLLALKDSALDFENVKKFPLLKLINEMGKNTYDQELLKKILSKFPKDLKINAEYKDLPPAFKLLVDRQAALKYLSDYTKTQLELNKAKIPSDKIDDYRKFYDYISNSRKEKYFGSKGVLNNDKLMALQLDSSTITDPAVRMMLDLRVEGDNPLCLGMLLTDLTRGKITDWKIKDGKFAATLAQDIMGDASKFNVSGQLVIPKNLQISFDPNEKKLTFDETTEAKPPLVNIWGVWFDTSSWIPKPTSGWIHGANIASIKVDDKGKLAFENHLDLFSNTVSLAVKAIKAVAGDKLDLTKPPSLDPLLLSNQFDNEIKWNA